MPPSVSFARRLSSAGQRRSYAVSLSVVQPSNLPSFSGAGRAVLRPSLERLNRPVQFISFLNQKRDDMFCRNQSAIVSQ
jgi:hypothetical protein